MAHITEYWEGEIVLFGKVFMVINAATVYTNNFGITKLCNCAVLVTKVAALADAI